MVITRIKINYGGKVRNTRRVERTLKLIVFLRNWQTINECAEKIAVSPRSIHRYLNMLTDLGFIVEIKHGKRSGYRIKNIKEFFGLV